MKAQTLKAKVRLVAKARERGVIVTGSKIAKHIFSKREIMQHDVPSPLPLQIT